MHSSNKAMPTQLLTATLKSYLLITKPGIILGNLVAMLGGFLLAAQGQVDSSLLLATVMGMALVVASGCVFNNCIDRDIDSRMERTQARVLVKGDITLPLAFAYAATLGLVGVVLLYTQTTPLAAACAITGWLVYVFAYSLYFKRNSIHGTLVGSFSGAVPPVIGYCAVTGQVDAAAVVLFAMFSLWQMPHFYAIAIFRYEDYARAKIPALPVAMGITPAKWQMAIYIVIFTMTASLLTVFNYTGYAYLAAALAMGLGWFYLCIKGFDAADDKVWARRVFRFSIAVVTVLSITMAVDYL